MFNAAFLLDLSMGFQRKLLLTPPCPMPSKSNWCCAPHLLLDDHVPPVLSSLSPSCLVCWEARVQPDMAHQVPHGSSKLVHPNHVLPSGHLPLPLQKLCTLPLVHQQPATNSRLTLSTLDMRAHHPWMSTCSSHPVLLAGMIISNKSRPSKVS